MSSMHWEPFRALRDLDRLSSQLLSGTRVPLTMPMDVWREAQSYHLAFDLPGVDVDSIDVHLEQNTLTVSAQRQAQFAHEAPQEPGDEPTGEGGVQVVVAERPQGNFSRQLALGEGLDTAAVQASYRDGVLHLTIPMRQQAASRRIQVSHRSGQTNPQISDPSE